MPAAIAREDGHLFSCTVQDFSDGGLGIKINGQAQILEGQKVNLLLKRGQQEYVFPTQVARVMGNEVGLKLMPLTTQQHIDFVQCEALEQANRANLTQARHRVQGALQELEQALIRHLAEHLALSGQAGEEQILRLENDEQLVIVVETDHPQAQCEQPKHGQRD